MGTGENVFSGSPYETFDEVSDCEYWETVQTGERRLKRVRTWGGITRFGFQERRNLYGVYFCEKMGDENK